MINDVINFEKCEKTNSLYVLLVEMGKHLVKHGDGVKDVAFQVEDLDAIVKVFLVMSVCACAWLYVVSSLYQIFLSSQKKNNQCRFLLRNSSYKS